MTDDETIAETNRILARMSSGEPFRFVDLWRPGPKGTAQIARNLVRCWKRRGWVERDIRWTLTDAGRAAVRKEPAND